MKGRKEGNEFMGELTKDEHLADMMRNRYKDFLLSRDLQDNLEQMTWLNNKFNKKTLSANQLITNIILEMDSTGYKDPGFEDVRRKKDEKGN